MLYFDFETTNKDYGSALVPENRIVMVAWAEDDGPVQYYYGDITDAYAFWGAYHQQSVMVAYNAKFEQHWIWRLGGAATNKTWHDPMLAEFVLRGNQRGKLSLGDVAESYGFIGKDPVIDALMKDGMCPSEMPRDRLIARCVRDVSTTRRLWKAQLRKLQEQGQVDVYRTRADFTSILTEIERTGMLLDSTRVAAVYAELSKRKGELERELHELTGGINLRSPDQMAHFLYETLKFPERKNVRGKPVRNKPSKQFPNGRPLTDKNTLEYLSKQIKTPQQLRFIELRREYGKVAASLSKNVEFFKGVCDEFDCTFYGQFNQTIAATHRLTSSGKPLEIPGWGQRSVQFQNMPREFKRLFAAPEGYYAVEVDASQLEFRVAVYLGDDKQGRADIENPEFDAHCKSASVMQDIPYDEFLYEYRNGTKEYKRWRQEAKSDTFKPLFGGTKGTPEQERWYKEFQNRYSGITAEQESWLAEVAATGCLKLPWGMQFTWNVQTDRFGVLRDKADGKPVGPKVFNYPVQNLATAEIVPMAIMALHRAVKRARIDAQFVNTVHDSIVCYVKHEHLDQFIALAQCAFTTDVYRQLHDRYGIDFDVPLGCEITYGSHWGDGTTIKYDDVHHRGHEHWADQSE